MNIWLVVWNTAFIFPYIGISSSQLANIFQRGRSTTNQILMTCNTIFTTDVSHCGYHANNMTMLTEAFRFHLFCTAQKDRHVMNCRILHDPRTIVSITCFFLPWWQVYSGKRLARVSRTAVTSLLHDWGSTPHHPAVLMQNQWL